MITVLRWRPPRRVVALTAAAMVATGLAAAVAHSSQSAYPYGVAGNAVIQGYNPATDGVIHGYGVLAADGVINADGGGVAISPDSNGVINTDSNGVINADGGGTAVSPDDNGVLNADGGGTGGTADNGVLHAN